MHIPKLSQEWKKKEKEFSCCDKTIQYDSYEYKSYGNGLMTGASPTRSGRQLHPETTTSLRPAASIITRAGIVGRNCKRRLLRLDTLIHGIGPKWSAFRTSDAGYQQQRNQNCKSSLHLHSIYCYSVYMECVVERKKNWEVIYIQWWL